MNAFFSEANLLLLRTMVNDRLTRMVRHPTNFVLTEEFTNAMVAAANANPVWLRTADGLRQLNELVVTQAARALTVPDQAGQYTANNYLYRSSRVKRSQRGSDVDEPTRHGSAVQLHNPHRRRVEEWRAEDRALQARADVLDARYGDGLAPELDWANPGVTFREL